MTDLSMPQEMIDWMNSRNWGDHHVEWHFVRRWDFWHALAPSEPAIQAMVDEAHARGWTRAALQEGESGSGIDFLHMHRAMLILLHREFPHHMHYLRGWTSPPTDPSDPGDPVPSGAAFDPDMALAIVEIESPSSSVFSDEDAWALFLETNLRPLPENPTNRSSDRRAGIHNYLHNRWSDNNSPVNLGDPQVNIFNQRFWRLHGWIDLQWWRMRLARGLSDSDPMYQASLQPYIQMMDAIHPHPHFQPGLAATALPRTVFNRFFEF